MSEAKLKRYLKRLYKDLNTLREREAKFGGNAPLELLNQIDDHQTAITLVESRLAGDLSDEQLFEQLDTLNINHNYHRANVIPIPTLPLVVISLSMLGLLSFISYRLVAPTPTPTATPLPTPSQMSGDFNIAIAEIGQQGADGNPSPSPDGQQLGRWIFSELQNEIKNLPQQFEVQVWHDGPELAAKNVKLGLVADDEAAARLAQTIKANLVIYGNLEGGQNPANFIPKFYIKPLQGEAGEMDELKGPFQLGAPIPIPIPLDTTDPILIASLKPEVSLRARALRWFTMGFIWDLAGQTLKALETFQQAEQALKDWGEKNEGKEILYYFIGREILFLSRDDQQAQKVFDSVETARTTAESYFKKALNSNPEYARAYLGLGSVYYQQAPQPLEARLATADLALAQYDKALEYAPKLPGEELVSLEAHFGKAVASFLKGDTLYKLGHSQGDNPSMYVEAGGYFEGTIREIEPILDPLAAAKQHRSLGHAYLALGGAYAQLALVREKQGRQAEVVPLYQKAQGAYTSCIAQGDAARGGNPYDALLKNIIDTYCRPYADRIAEKLLDLEEEP
ncbi:MAG: hypothetical protein L6R45_35745 [Anaerolineae bacterium]|nr:hypothetical protein [Anaerolineae bacterium]